MKQVQKIIFSLLLGLFCISALAKHHFTVSITGVEKSIYQNIIANIEQKNPTNTGLDDTMIKERYFLNIGYIKEALQPFGYFNPSIKPSLRKTPQGWVARYVIDPGPKTRYQSIYYSKNIQPSWIPHDNLAIGKVFTATGYKKTKDAIVHAANQAGYIYANINNSSVTIDEVSHSATANIILELGQRYYFGNIIFNHPYVDYHFLLKYAPFSSGDIYNVEKVAAFSKNLDKSRLFKNTKVITNPPQDNRIHIDVNPTMKPKHEYQIGLGFDTDEYLQGMFSVTDNYASREGATSNFYIKASLSQVESGISYTTPGNDPINSHEVFSVHVNTKDDQDIGYSNFVEASIAKRTRVEGLSYEHSMNIHYEKSEPNDEPTYFSTLVYPRVGIYSDTKHIGKLRYTWHTNALASAKGLASSVNLIRAKWYAQLIYPITDTIELSNKLQLGGLVTNNFDNVPLSFQFAAGGANSIRAYSYNSIGPGKFLRVLNTELYYEVYDEIYWGIFADIGTVTQKINTGKYYIGAGPTLQWKSPIGNINVALAFPVHADETEWHIQMSFSPHL